ncbi:MAG: hypothetical protein HY928_13690 [Elusimicrobia bacterium]|nr:hypothetical protein [Elusimicrobiota bacterium]
MTNRGLLRAAALLSVMLAGCRGADYWLERLESDPAYRSAAQVRRGAGCKGLVPIEFGATFPVPARDGENRFKVLFYPTDNAPGMSRVMAPAVEGSFSLDSPDKARCLALKPSSATKSLGPAVPPGTSNEAFYRSAFTLYSLLSRVEQLYSGGGQLGAADEQSLRDFAGAFLALAEPGLLEHYYRVNPDFWEWLRKNAGRSLPPADPSPAP